MDVSDLARTVTSGGLPPPIPLEDSQMDSSLNAPETNLPAQTPVPILRPDPAQFRRDFCRAPFAFQHALAESGLFSLASLERATDALIRSGKAFRVLVRDAQGGLDTRFDDIPERQRSASMFERLESSNAWIRLNNVGDVDQRYASLIDAVVKEIGNLADKSEFSKVTQAQFSVFISSPFSVTPFHIDHEANFLCQVHGEKDVCVYRPDDREVLPEVAIERFYVGEVNAATYRGEMDSHGTVFRLAPGVAVHHPPLAAHWVRNTSDVSVSVSINLCMRHIDRRAHVYQVNHILRKLGLSPSPPGKSRIVDFAKAGTLAMASTSRPRSTSDIVFSGLNRLRAPIYFARNLRDRLAPSARH
jgi:hypothetical protein